MVLERADIKHGWGYENGKPYQADPATNNRWNDHNAMGNSMDLMRSI